MLSTSTSLSGQLSDAEFDEALRTFAHTAFRLELQPVYLVDYERQRVARFLAGDPQYPSETSYSTQWQDQIRRLTREGKRVGRVRVQEDPQTDYQRWERWVGQWNIAAGECMRYMTRQQAHEVGLLPAAGDQDWWLLDSQRLIVMNFDAEGHPLSYEWMTDPPAVLQACAWRDLAVHHSIREHVHDPPLDPEEYQAQL
ncbi:MAG: hypothetical protein DLM59_17215 [Pseudonocardiales bacterium]|nr:MAG: hypothetical protein DLM59_17215 [Pseudonocardiales bacterium]